MDRTRMIEKFIEGRLSKAELEEFNALVETDSDFKKEVNFYLNLNKVTEAEDDDHFRAILSDFESEIKSRKKRLPTRWMLAASIALIAALTYIFVADFSPSTEKLFAQNFEPYPNVVNPIVRGEEGVNQKTKAFVAYQNKDYSTAEALFTELLSAQEEPHYQFYKANALLQLNRGQEAIPLLKKRLSVMDELSEKTGWYLAMAYLQVDEPENAEKILQTVVEENTFKVEEAKKLIRSLQKLTSE